MKYKELRQAKQKAMDQLLTDCSVFFAFSNEQFQKNKTPLMEGEKYVSIGAGGFIPKSKVQGLTAGMKAIEATYRKAIKESKQREAEILYELQNHEAFYTCDIKDTLEALGEGFTEAEVWKVYNENKAKEMELRA